MKINKLEGAADLMNAPNILSLDLGESLRVLSWSLLFLSPKTNSKEWGSNKEDSIIAGSSYSNP